MSTKSRLALALMPAALLFFTTFTAQCLAGGNREILWDIVTNCLDPAVADYDTLCRWPVESSSAACRKTTGVWNLSSEFVILRDIKMCDCPADKTFVHGLAIPRTKITGSEDPNRPDGIWQFAWDSAIRRIGKVADIALVVNPPGPVNRGQDQLHVHLVRLNEDGRRLIAAAKVSSVGSLADVWRKADQLAAQRGLEYYGVLVARHPAGGFVVHVDDHNLEDDYTEARCP